MVNNKYVDKSGYWFEYIELVRKSDGKQVYTSPLYLIDGVALDIPMISKKLNYYFERINGAIDQQLANPKLTEEQKKQLKKIEYKDYVVNLTQCEPPGYAHQHFWSREASEFLVN